MSMKICKVCHEMKPLETGFYLEEKNTVNPKYKSKCKNCQTIYQKDYYKKNHKECRAKLKADKKALRRKVLLYYSGGTQKCACCGEGSIEFLALDHINGNGNKHRREISKGCGGQDFYNWIRKNQFPEGFRVLCHNCNMSLGFYGYCPHNQAKIEADILSPSFKVAV